MRINPTKHKHFFFCILLLSFIFKSNAQLVVSNTAPYNSINYLVQNILLGSGVVASNITYTGSPLAVGYFNGLSSNLGIDSGLIITSGDLPSAVGPNNSGSAGVDNGLNGDAQLEQFTGSSPSYDASVLEFDFIANSDTVKFDYIFGSDEYMEYVNSGYNDAFAFIISGVTVTLPAKNIALIPSPPAPPNTPVTIDNVNLGSYSQYYFDNGNGTIGGTAPDGLTVQYDGFTKILTAKSAIQCGETYHIKIVIADIFDGIYDSGVFLKAGSFSSASGQVVLSTTLYNGTVQDSILREVCGSGCVSITRSNSSNLDSLTLSYSGSATNGVDITLLPNKIFFAPGQDSVSFCFDGLLDEEKEEAETLTILVSNIANTCDSLSISFVIIEDCLTNPPNVISADGDGINDYFFIKNIDRYTNSRLMIFDRWGIKLLDDPNYKNTWDAYGYSAGTYYYVLYRSDGEVFPGYLTVLR